MATDVRRPRAGSEGELLARLWPALDPALDSLPAGELVPAVLEAIRVVFAAPAAAVIMESGERIGAGEDDPAWERSPRMVVGIQDGVTEVGRLELVLRDAALGSEERLALRLIATRLGRAIARRRIEAEAAAAQEKLRADAYAVQRLYRVASSLMAEHDLDQVVQAVTDEATALAGAQFGAFFYNVLDERGESYMLYTLSGVPRSAFERFPMPRNTAVFAPTFTGSGVVRSDDITKDPRYGHNAPLRGMPPGHLPVRSYLAAPVASRNGEVLGGLFFGHRVIGVFDDESERLVVAIAALAALAIENARLHDTAQRELEASRRALAERDEVARVLQTSLLPPVLPEIDGLEVAGRYVPGEGIAGGDFYDLFPLRPGVWSAAIGDVEGKGPGAAARTSLIRHAVRVAASRTRGPSETLRIVNDAVLQEQDPEDPRFATLQLARLITRGPRGVSVYLASGGHPPALVLRADGGVEEVAGHGTLIGVVEDLTVSESALELEPGDALVLYTDGLTEARRHGAQLGERRVGEILAGLSGKSAEGIAAGLARASEEWGDAPRRDDLALLVLKVAA